MENNNIMMFSLSEYEERARGRSNTVSPEENSDITGHLLFSIISSIDEDTKFDDSFNCQVDHSYFQSSNAVTAF